MNYGYTFKERLVNRIKRFFLLTFIFSAIIIGGGVYFFKSDFGNSVQLVKDFKEHTNQQISKAYEEQTTEFSNAVRKDLGLEPVKVETKQPIVNTTPTTTKETPKTTVPVPNPTVEKPTPKPETPASSPSVEKPAIVEKPVVNTPVVEQPVIKTTEVNNPSGFPLFKIPFYYDHSNAPKGVTKEEALAILQKSSQQWTDACGVTFEYKGDKLADYVNNKNVINGQTGIIKWETQLEGNAIGEAHVGSSRGPAPGFVLALYSDFFAKNKNDLVNTVTHEMGHVIGLDHSANKRSIMFPTEHANSTLQESDKAMCRYFRYRWSGMNQKQAQEKTGIVSNGGYD